MTIDFNINDDFGLRDELPGFLQCMSENDTVLSDDDDFVNEAMDEYYQETNQMTFGARDTLPPNANSDGYIPNGSQELTSTVSDIHKTFKLYSKNGHDYVLYNGAYYRIDGSGTVTIGGIKYDKI